MSIETSSAAPSFVCRCEELDEAELRAAIDAGARTINDLKRRTRAAMGVCQGAYCLHHMAELLAETTGTTVAEILPMTSRPPVRLIELRVMANDGEPT